MTSANNCVFCHVAEKTAPGSFVYEDKVTAAFLDIRPVNPGHTLVIPRRHAGVASELEPAALESVWRTGVRVGEALRRSGLRCEGVNFFVADGGAAGQDVFHFHLHVIPRYRGDGVVLVRLPFDHEGNPAEADRRTLDSVASRIRSAI